MLLALFLACDTTTVYIAPTCTLDAPVVEPAKAAPGDEVRLSTRALTETWDTTVLFGSTVAPVIRVDRDSCADCDSCLVDTGVSGCLPCTPSCDACAETCATCEESVVVTVPDLAPGTYAVVLTNVHGTSQTGSIVITGK